MARNSLVERDGEVAVLRIALREAVAGRGAVALVTGPAGIGKTSLATVLAEEAAAMDMPVLRGRAVPDEGSPALWPWWQALQGKPELLDLLDRHVTGASPHAVAQRLRDFERLLGALSGTPRLIVLEDLHWADELTLRLLRHASGRPGLLVLATARDTEWPDEVRDVLTEVSRDPATVAVRLRPWSPAGTARFVDGVAHPSWGPVLHRHCGGNPLYAGELLAELTQAGRADAAAPDDGWPLGVPTRLLDMVRGRLATLPDPVRDLVAAAALLGLEAPVAAVAAILGATEPDVLMTATRAAGLLRHHADVLAFEHMLVRDACYDALAPDARVTLHRRVAELIDAGAVAGESVTHWLRCAIDDDSRAAALAACKAAAERARGAAALLHAADLLDAALRVYQGPHVPRIELMLDAADLDYGAGRTESALTRCVEAADLAERHDAPELLARAALVVRGIVGPSAKTIMALCDRALAVLPQDALGQRARVLAQRALLLAEVVGCDHADEPSRTALRLAEQSGDPVALADALRARQQAISGCDGVTERLRLATRLLDLGDAAPPGSELWARLWRIDAALQLGTIGTLDDELVRLDLLADRLGWPIAYWHLHHVRGVRALLAGRFDVAEAAADEALRWALQTEDFAAVAIDVPFRAELLSLTGRHDELRDRLVVSLGTPMPDALMPVVLAGSGVFLMELGDTDRAAWCLDQVRPRLAPLSRHDGRWVRTMWSGAELAAGLGDLETATWCYERLLPFAGYYLAAGSGSVVCSGSVSRQLGVIAAALGRTETARTQLTEGIAMDDRIGAVGYRTLGEVALAELTGDMRLAEQAEITARRLGMRPAAERAAALRRTAATAEGSLTKRERQILGLLVAGRANRQIAEEFVLSERTVESHVSNVLGKLGVHTRAEAVAWAHAHRY